MTEEESLKAELTEAVLSIHKYCINTQCQNCIIEDVIGCGKAVEPHEWPYDESEEN